MVSIDILFSILFLSTELNGTRDVCLTGFHHCILSLEYNYSFSVQPYTSIPLFRPFRHSAPVRLPIPLTFPPSFPLFPTSFLTPPPLTPHQPHFSTSIYLSMSLLPSPFLSPTLHLLPYLSSSLSLATGRLLPRISKKTCKWVSNVYKFLLRPENIVLENSDF